MKRWSLAKEYLSQFGLWNLRYVYDFEAPDLPLRARLKRIQQALLIEQRQCTSAATKDEISYALADCEALLALPALDAEVVDRERVAQRIARMKRVAIHHEGLLSSLNRRYWWIPCSGLLFLMAVYLLPDLLSLFK